MGNNSPALVSSTRYETLGIGTGIGTNVTAGTLHTKGSYATIGTSSFDYDGIILCVQPSTATSQNWRIDIAINTGGSDQIIVEDWFAPIDATVGKGHNVYIPVFVPKGAVVKARAQTAHTTNVVNVAVVGFQGDENSMRGFRALRSLTDWGASSESPSNSVAMSGTTLTGWVQIAASSACRVSAIYASVDTLSAVGGATGSFEVGWGAAASEKALFRISWAYATSVTRIPSVPQGPFPCDFPAGTRFAVRGQASASDTFSVALHGLQP